MGRVAPDRFFRGIHFPPLTMITIGLLHTGIRGDEKLLIKAAKTQKVKLEVFDLRSLVLSPNNLEQFKTLDVMLDRCVSTSKGIQAIKFFEEVGTPVINCFDVASLCENKFATTTRLMVKKVPAVEAALVFSEKEAKKVVGDMGGYPVVIKSTHGSWGRLMAKVSDEESLEAIIEHKLTLGSPQHHAFYIQKYVNKPGRDIRAFVIDGKTICAIYRNSPHWITNTARGGKATNCQVTKQLVDLCQRTSRALGGGVLAMDVFETNDGLKINEVNHTMEFKNSEQPTGVSISGEILKYCKRIASKNGKKN